MAKAKRKEDPGRVLALLAARIADDRHLEDIVALNLTGISPVADYFVVCTAASDRQMRSVAQEIIDEAARCGRPVFRAAGMESCQWIVLDFVDVVVHLFDQEHRRYYDLELIWGDAPRLRWRSAVQKRQAQTKEADDGTPA